MGLHPTGSGLEKNCPPHWKGSVEAERCASDLDDPESVEACG